MSSDINAAAEADDDTSPNNCDDYGCDWQAAECDDCGEPDCHVVCESCGSEERQCESR